MLRLTSQQVEAALFAVSDVVTRRRMFGQPIPPAVVALRQKLEIASVCGTETDSEAEQLKDDLIDSDTAAEILGYSSRWVRKIHASLDGRCIAGSWVFQRQKVIEYAEGRRCDAD
jgi:hypothetical protein